MPGSTAESFASLVATVRRLRAPGGCPWDRAQTHQSLRPYLIEEAYEVLDVLDRIPSGEALSDGSIREAFREELGDLLMQVLLHSEIASETGAFDAGEVARCLEEKLIRRHPHVFGQEKADGADQALANWEREKAKEKKPGASSLDGLPRALPALQRAARMIEKVTKVGFQWKDLAGPIAKVEEEWRELRQELGAWESVQSGGGAESAGSPDRIRERVASELGDHLFTICNVAFLAGVSPEDALRGTLARFERRFRHVETRLAEQGRRPEQSTLEEMDRYWDEAKAKEAKS